MALYIVCLPTYNKILLKQGQSIHTQDPTLHFTKMIPHVTF